MRRKSYVKQTGVANALKSRLTCSVRSPLQKSRRADRCIRGQVILLECGLQYTRKIYEEESNMMVHVSKPAFHVTHD